MKNVPRFIAVEGVGRIVQKILSEELEIYFIENGLDVVVTNEPSYGSLGHRIQKILDGKMPALKTSFEFQQLCVEDRFEHIRRAIRPHLQLGNWVLSIGYWFATLAQGMLDGSLEQCLKLHRDIIGKEMLHPDLTLLLDAPVEQEKFEKVRINYLKLAAMPELGAAVVIDAGQDKQKISDAAIAALRPFL